MKLSIKNSIYQAIIHNKWLDISYTSKEKETTKYYIGIKDLKDIEEAYTQMSLFDEEWLAVKYL